eukprot:CAMPEP_0117668196 /NCGR_PEP_ID=MMETSP0804-20121206/11406_1 /TAXON_ID=1074897 /ORGANISM="Tetraselmis astigmatica, Strain CCMP880" /LENGTH=165 /DNA_ID=CAMNT_0005476043 /DNA_START=276 /DNA_END=776 /DNA_ORIENTATION=+
MRSSTLEWPTSTCGMACAAPLRLIEASTVQSAVPLCSQLLAALLAEPALGCQQAVGDGTAPWKVLRGPGGLLAAVHQGRVLDNHWQCSCLLEQGSGDGFDTPAGGNLDAARMLNLKALREEERGEVLKQGTGRVDPHQKGIGHQCGPSCDADQAPAVQQAAMVAA